MEQSDRYQEARDVWDDHNRRQEFEHSLIDRKTTWLLTTQALLFAAYGVTFQSNSPAGEVERFREIVSWSGVAIAVISLLGTVMIINAKRLAWRTYEHFFETQTDVRLPKPHDRLEWGVRTWNTRLALVPELTLPIVFIVGWLLQTPVFR